MHGAPAHTLRYVDIPGRPSHGSINRTTCQSFDRHVIPPASISDTSGINKMNNPFAEEALFMVNATDARVTVIQAQLSNLDLDTVRTTPGARAILAGSKGANQIDHQDVFLFPYSEDVNEAGAPICNCTAVSLATTDTLMILVADTDGGMAGRLFLVGSTLGIGHNENLIGKPGTSIHVNMDPAKVELLEAGPAVTRIAQVEYAKLKGMQPYHLNAGEIGLGGPHHAIAAAVAGVTTTAAQKSLYFDLTSQLESYDSISLMNVLFSPGHMGPDRAPAQALSIKLAKQTMLSAFNSMKKDSIGSEPLTFPDASVEALCLGKFGRGPSEFPLNSISRPADDKPTVTAIERNIRVFALAWAVIHGPIAAARIQAMAVKVREALDFDESQGDDFAKVIEWYLGAYGRIPAVLPAATTRTEFVTNLYNVTAASPEIVAFKTNLVLKNIKYNAMATEKLAEAHAKNMTAFKIEAAAFSHGSTADKSPIRGGKAKAVVSTPNSPARGAKTTAPTFTLATPEEIAKWKAARPSFLTTSEKVMCKITATTGTKCGRQYCKANDAYKGPTVGQHTKVVDWVKQSPFGK